METEKFECKRICYVGPASYYHRYRRLMLGKWVRVYGRGDFGGRYIEFFNEEVRRRVNEACGFSPLKKRYLLEDAKFADGPKKQNDIQYADFKQKSI